MYIYIYIRIYVYRYMYMCIYIYIYILTLSLHPVSVRRFPSFRTQPLEKPQQLPMNKTTSEQPSPENILSGNLVMETGCTNIA